MERLVPVPFIDHVPDEIKTGAGPLGTAMDDQINGLVDDAFGIEYLKDPARAPAQFLEAFGYQLAADLQSGDSESVKRSKIATAQYANSMRGLWVESVKPIVDIRAMGDSRLFSGVGSDDFIICGKGDEPEGYYWSIIGGASASDPFGIRIVAGGGVAGYGVDTFKGNVLIDVDNAALTTEEVAALVADLTLLVPAFFHVYLGYMSGSAFIAYPNGLIGG